MALKMTWQPSLLPQKRKNGPPLGLKNLGNTCYLNSVLQCLTYTPPLANFCLKNQHSSSCDSATEADRKRDCPFCIIEKQIVRSLSIDSPLDTPSKISSCLRIFAEHFRFGRQEDAHEFLRYVIDACHNTCLRLKKLQQQRRKGGVSNGGEGFNGSTAVKEIFGGALQSQVKCLSCGTESNKVDEIMDISLDVLHSSSLKESLQKFFQPEVLDGNNKYKCENCKKLVVARKQMSILQAPNVLVIQLKRFEGIFGGKVDKAIAFGEVLVLSSYMCKGSQDSHPEYNLFGTIVHSGFSPDSGHYYSYIKDAMGRWYCCNDSYVSLSTLQEVLSEKVYILFFSRTKQRPVPATTALSSNGVKSQGSNGSHTSKIPKTVSPIKALHTKPSVDCSSEKEKSTKPMVDKTPSSSQMKLSSLGNSGTTKLPAVSVNMKFFVNKRQPIERNGNAKASVCMEKSEKDMSSVISSNGSGKSKAVDGENSQGLTLANGDGKKDVASLISSNGSGKIKPVNGENSQEFPLANGNGKKDVGSLASSNGSGKSKPVDGENSQEIPLENCNGKKDVPSLISSNGSGKSKTVVAENSQVFPLENGNGKSHIRPEMHENNDMSNRVMFGRGANYHESQNGGVHYPTDISGSKRKRDYEDSCILFAKDDHLRAKLEDLKEGLGKEAALVLRSCGWSDEVDRFMRSRKKLCAREVGNTASNGDELRKLLITQAKQTFISQIPESLKENLIERLRSASQEKQLLGP